MERLTDEQREVVKKRNEGARSEAHSTSIKNWYYWQVELNRVLKNDQILYLYSLNHNNHIRKFQKRDLQNTWRNLVNR